MLIRIQTLYLIIALISCVLLFFFPFAKSGSYEFFTRAIITPESIKIEPLLLPLHIIITVLILISVFFFKNRIIQMRVVAVAFLFNIALLVCIFFYSDIFRFPQILNYKNFGILLPIIVLIMLILTNKAIKNDEIKIRKSSQIR